MHRAAWRQQILGVLVFALLIFGLLVLRSGDRVFGQPGWWRYWW